MARLQLQQSVAIERYDGIQDQLQQAVSTELINGDQASDVAAQAQHAQDAVVDRARALYMSGGQLSLIATVLRGATPATCSSGPRPSARSSARTTVTAAADQAVAVQAAGRRPGQHGAGRRSPRCRQQATASLAQVQLLLARAAHPARRTPTARSSGSPARSRSAAEAARPRRRRQLGRRRRRTGRVR